jgi:hypothetical protein
MARRCRRAIPGIQYRATQGGGNRRQQTFVEAADFAPYFDLLAQSAQKAGGALPILWIWRRMQNSGGACGCPKPRADRLATMHGLRRWKRKPAERSNPKSAGQRGGGIRCI